MIEQEKEKLFVAAQKAIAVAIADENLISITEHACELSSLPTKPHPSSYAGNSWHLVVLLTRDKEELP